MNPQNGYDIEDISVGMSAEVAKTITDADIRKTWIFFGDPAAQLLHH